MKKIFIITLIILCIPFSVSAEYILNSKDISIIKKIETQINKIIQKKGVKYGNKLVGQLNRAKRKSKIESRTHALLNEITINTARSNVLHYSDQHYNDFQIDYNQVSNYWIQLHNDIRKSYKAQTLHNDNKLNATAFEWSNMMNNKWVMDHMRNPDDGWYNYPIIEQWFQDRWVKCNASNGVTSSESIGTYWFYCAEWQNCTEKLKSSLKEIFDVYMAEKWLPYPWDSHYRSIIHPSFSKIWLWIYFEDAPIDKNGWWWKDYYNYYVSTHYCTTLK